MVAHEHENCDQFGQGFQHNKPEIHSFRTRNILVLLLLMVVVTRNFRAPYVTWKTVPSFTWEINETLVHSSSDTDQSFAATNVEQFTCFEHHTEGMRSKRKNNQTGIPVIDWSDSIFQRWGWDNDPVVIESHKLLFFTVPKNSCTAWKMLFRRMMNYSDWRNPQPWNPDTNGLKYLGHYPRHKQQEFMTSTKWTRAIFVRNPLQRLLSAFLDKAHGTERYIRQHCCRNTVVRQRNSANQIFQQQCEILEQLGNTKLPTENDFPFQNFVDGFMWQCADPHWAPQYKRMKPRNWEFIDSFGNFDTLQRDARCLLERIGAWEAYGARGWGKHGNLSFLERNTARHSTSSKTLLEKYYDPDIQNKVLNYLRQDYEFRPFLFSTPESMAHPDAALTDADS